ncbi:hypothetical protein EDD86DRAFT_102336 [Gorgonomyces haynaldii]|nr:hypothetical protein EDD86DRAFT_102336 [Gorgonomyces haynaldii]
MKTTRSYTQSKANNTSPRVQDNLVCFVVLSEDQSGQDFKKETPNGYDSNLLGTPITTCQILWEAEGVARQGMFFIFPDLGVRAAGTYTFSCFLMHIDTTKDEFPVSKIIKTQPFHVYPPNVFPGMPSIPSNHRTNRTHSLVPPTRCQL